MDYVRGQKQVARVLCGRMKDYRDQNPFQRAALMSEAASKQTGCLATILDVSDKDTPLCSLLQS